MKEILEKILEEKFSDGTVEKIVGKEIEKLVSSTLEDMFGYSSTIKTKLKERLDPIMSNAVENIDLSRYLAKVTTLLNEQISGSQLKPYAKVLSNTGNLLDNDIKYEQEIQLSDIFKKYCEFIKNTYSESDFETSDFERGDSHKYVNIECSMEVENEEKSYFCSSDTWTVKLRNSKSENGKFVLNDFQFRVYKSSYLKKNFLILPMDISIQDLPRVDDFVIYLFKIANQSCDIQIDTQMFSNEDVELEFEYSIS